MNIYEFRGEGLALGSVVAVIAKTLVDATVVAESWAAENGVKPESLRYAGAKLVTVPMVAFGWNGDY
jgi:hypothetical protein